jgi:hypothetical protein
MAKQREAQVGVGWVRVRRADEVHLLQRFDNL